MKIIRGVLVSEEIIEKCFCCDIATCKGMCCVEGDTGAPLDPLEVGDLEEYYPLFKPFMTPDGIAKVEEDGLFDYDIAGQFVTPLVHDEECAFAYYEGDVAKCAIEQAFLQGLIDFQKPISCHLYPIRIRKLPDYDALNLHHWFVCQDAYLQGKEKKIFVYQFLKGPLIRKYGEDWYKELEKVAHDHTSLEQ